MEPRGRQIEKVEAEGAGGTGVWMEAGVRGRAGLEVKMSDLLAPLPLTDKLLNDFRGTVHFSELPALLESLLYSNPNCLVKGNVCRLPPPRRQ